MYIVSFILLIIFVSSQAVALVEDDKKVSSQKCQAVKNLRCTPHPVHLQEQLLLPLACGTPVDLLNFFSQQLSTCGIS